MNATGVLYLALKRYMQAAELGLLLAMLLLLFIPCISTAQETPLKISTSWTYVSDTVMGGISKGRILIEHDADASYVRLIGDVSLENNGGFIQMAADLAPAGEVFDASEFSGVWLRVRGNGERYDLRLRTDAVTRPWQSFRADFVAGSEWSLVRLPFTAFEAHRITADFEAARLRRVGILAIGRVFSADISVSEFGFY